MVKYFQCAVGERGQLPELWVVAQQTDVKEDFAQGGVEGVALVRRFSGVFPVDSLIISRPQPNALWQGHPVRASHAQHPSGFISTIPPELVSDSLSAITVIKITFCYCCSEKNVQLIESKKDLACELVASWTVQVGDLDQCLHLWRYTGGFEKVDLAERELKKDPVSARGSSWLTLLSVDSNNFRISWNSLRSAEDFWEPDIFNTCSLSATGQPWCHAKAAISTRCARIAWSLAQWLSGETTGLAR